MFHIATYNTDCFYPRLVLLVAMVKRSNGQFIVKAKIIACKINLQILFVSKNIMSIKRENNMTKLDKNAKHNKAE